MFCSKRERIVSCLELLIRLFAPFVRECSREWRVGGLCVDAVPYNRQSTRVLLVDALLAPQELRENRLNVNPGNTGARRSIFPCLERCCKVSL